MKRPLMHTAVVFLATLALSTRGADALVATNGPASGASVPSNKFASRTESPSKGPSLEAFRLISERNIFNPNRSGRGGDRETSRREPERRVRTESIALVGTISYDKGDFAFFDGSNSDYRRSLQTSGTIGGFTITSITPQCVILRPSGTNEMEIKLPLGMQLQRHDEGRWEVASRPDHSGSSSASTSSSSSSSSSSAGGSDEVLKRLMQQREQEGGAPAPSPAAVPASAPAVAPAASPSSSGPESDILKRLMQRREKGE